MMFTNRFQNSMTASAPCAEASYACENFAHNNIVALIMDATFVASIIISIISITAAITILSLLP